MRRFLDWATTADSLVATYVFVGLVLATCWVAVATPVALIVIVAS